MNDVLFRTIPIEITKNLFNVERQQKQIITRTYIISNISILQEKK
jgi:hypothetical protein